MDIDGVQDSGDSITLTSGCAMDISGIQHAFDSITLNSAGNGDIVSGPPTFVASSSSTCAKPVSSKERMRRLQRQFTVRLGMCFSTLEEGLLFYKVYAITRGFEPRPYTSKPLRFDGNWVKYVVCNRHGFQKRNNSVNPRTGCNAMIRFKYNGEGYVVDMLHAGHNHFVFSVKDSLRKLATNLMALEKVRIINTSKVTIGPSRTFKFYKDPVNVGLSMVELKKYQRDVKSKDVEMFVDHFNQLSVSTNDNSLSSSSSSSSSEYEEDDEEDEELLE